MVNILVTGGAGFIGSHVVDILVKDRKNKVYVLDNLSSGKLVNLNKKAIFIRGDIRDNLNDLFKGIKIDYIIHMAAQISVRRSLDLPDVNDDVNIKGSLNLIDFAVQRKVKKFVFSSSAAVYSSKNALPIQEDSEIGPISPYGKSKYAIEKVLVSLSKAWKLKSTVLRYANVYGPRQDSAGEAGVISLFFNAALNGKQLNIFGSGEQTRDFIYVKDIAAANVVALDLEGVYNVSNNTETRILDLAQTIVKISKSKSKIVHLPKIKGEIMNSRSDNSKLLLSGWIPTYSLEEGLKESYDWFKKDVKIKNFMKEKKRILELCDFSAGGCGVFARARQESQILSDRGHDLAIFSSNREKGTNKIVPALDRIGNILIRRFPAVKLGGESFMYWNFAGEAIKFKPDVIFAHSYRHPHTSRALKIAKTLGCKVYLVTHAPFARSSTRTRLQRAVVWAYDSLFARSYLNKFDKIITISHWEKPYLIRAGAKEDKIEYIPNGIPDEFFTIKAKGKEENKILFFGRVSRIKRIESVIKALPLLVDKSTKLEIVGPREEEYSAELKKLVAKLGLQKRVAFTDAIYDVKKKIEKMDSAKYCVLASLSEGMPQGLVEYMAREKIVFASNNPGNADLVGNGKNGLLFEIDNSEQLAEKINNISKMSKKDVLKIKKNALHSVKLFAWSNIVKKIENLI